MLLCVHFVFGLIIIIIFILFVPIGRSFIMHWLCANSTTIC